MGDMSTLTFEEDYDSEEFRKSNTIEFRLRSEVFKVRRLTMQELDDLAEQGDDKTGTLTTTFQKWFSARLTPSDFDRFWRLVNDTDNPVRPKTLVEIINSVNAELQGVGDDEETPKD